jgi:hypothetical protein
VPPKHTGIALENIKLEYDEDYAEEMYYEKVLGELKREHGDEIADEITTGEVVDAALAAHKEWWERSQAALGKSLARLSEGEFGESLFHTGRAFDGYIHNVLVVPLRCAFIERLRRFMPPTFPVKERDFLKSIRGLGGAVAFAEYTISLIADAPAKAEATIKAFRELMNPGRTGQPSWSDRDRAFHAPIEVPEQTARILLERARSVLDLVAVDMKRLSDAETEARERLEYSPGRMVTLHTLAALYDEDPKATIEGYRIPLRSDAIEDRDDALKALLEHGFIEGVDVRTSDFPVPKIEYRLTDEGRRYYHETILPRLPGHLRLEGSLAAAAMQRIRTLRKQSDKT